MEWCMSVGDVMLKKSVLALVAVGASCLLHAAPLQKKTSSSQEEAYDADLFNRDKSVYFVNAEFLYWLVNEGAVDYAVKMNKRAWSTTQNTFAIGNYQNAHFDWSPGFRVNVGYFRAPHFWDAFLQYTYLPASGSRTAHAPHKSNEFLNGTWIQPDLGSGNPSAPLRKASCHIDLKYNVLDFLFTRRFEPNDHLRIGLFGGLTSALIFQKMKVSYEDVNDVHSHIANRWRFEGVGIRVGMKLDWYMGWDIFITGQVSAAALSGWYKNTAHQKTQIALPNANPSRPIRDAHFHDNRLTYTTQFLLGPSWQKRWESVRTELFAGYEMNIWTNLHQIYRSSFDRPTAVKETMINNSNVSLQGLTVRLNVDF